MREARQLGGECLARRAGLRPPDRDHAEVAGGDLGRAHLGGHPQHRLVRREVDTRRHDPDDLLHAVGDEVRLPEHRRIAPEPVPRASLITTTAVAVLRVRRAAERGGHAERGVHVVRRPCHADRARRGRPRGTSTCRRPREQRSSSSDAPCSARTIRGPPPAGRRSEPGAVSAIATSSSGLANGSGRRMTAFTTLNIRRRRRSRARRARPSPREGGSAAQRPQACRRSRARWWAIAAFDGTRVIGRPPERGARRACGVGDGVDDQSRYGCGPRPFPPTWPATPDAVILPSGYAIEEPPPSRRLTALADATRARLLLVLERHELSVGELCAVLQLPQSTVSRHLKTLADDGWVVCRVDGRAGAIAGPRSAASRAALAARARRGRGAVAAPHDLHRIEGGSRSAHEVGGVLRVGGGRWDALRAELFGARRGAAGAARPADDELVVGDLG